MVVRKNNVKKKKHVRIKNKKSICQEVKKKLKKKLKSLSKDYQKLFHKKFLKTSKKIIKKKRVKSDAEEVLKLQIKIRDVFRKIDNKEIKPRNAKKILLKLAFHSQEIINKNPSRKEVLTNTWINSLDETFKNYSKEERLEWLLKPLFWEDIYKKAPFLKERKNPERRKIIMKQAVKDFKEVREKPGLKNIFKIRKKRPEIIIWTPNRFDTKIDLLLKILETKQKITLGKLSKILKEDYDIVEEWANILEEEGVIKLTYPLIGDAYIERKEEENERKNN